MNNAELMKGYLKKHIGDNQFSIEQSLKRFMQNEDILKEFSYYLQNKKFTQSPIEVCGYTAESLYNKHKKHLKTVFDAYGYLILLREKPEYALDLIERGFPIK